jgi:pimeloyl-ACP methyl ester carboxylesterase
MRHDAPREECMTERRAFLKSFGASGAALAMAGADGALAQGRRASPRNYVLVHGAAHGAWCWSRVAERLQKAGHRVYMPTLTGLGDRKHLLTNAVNLDTHCTDVMNFIEAEELDNVILVAHSYSGLVVTLVADRMPKALGQLVYLDATVPLDGESWGGQNPEVIAQRVAAALDYTARQNLPVPVMQFSLPFDTARFLGVTDPADVEWVNRRCVDQPLSTFLQPARLKNPPGNGIRRAYVACTGKTLATFDKTKARIKQDSSWDYHTLPTGHNLMVTMPQEVSEILLKYA